ncbi:5-methylthioadenosine/S-adenosylhomocysteine deaminase [Lasiodiplodia theobromae]|uniref:5-methylthioadenosine/S-adenosylhomocysteine deaminase n=1 Tax=Lasiodiplodia theobromae TaxID=45133 RepID=A0A5N5D033_9PEZI|nr:5-methylthioadenosine/S-adenosylhomocysteine deaminase [Lasiodiplodia theobromae]
MARSTLLENGTVISFDDASQSLKVLHNTSVLVTGTRIAAIFDSNTSNPPDIPKDAERVDASNKIISPGFVDTHRHGWQTQFRTLASNTTLAEYFYRYGQYTQAKTVFTPSDIYYGQLAGIYEALNAGVTSILEHAHGTFSPEASAASLQASLDSGVRMWWCYGFSAFDDASIADFRTQAASHPSLAPNADSLVQYGMAYDGWASASASEIDSVVALARDPASNVAAFTTHTIGGPWHFDNGPVALTSKSPAAADFVANAPFPIVFSHGSFLSPADAALLRQHDRHVSITPESEMHYGHDHPATAHVMDQAALGVDTHFTFSSDILTQTRLWLQTVRRGAYRRTLEGWAIPTSNPMSVRQAFLLATRNGGLALRRDDVGVVRVGAVADLVLFDGGSPNMLGWADAVAAVVLHANVGDIKDVMVGGEWRKRDGVLVTRQDRREVEEKFLESAKRIQKIWKDTPLPVVEGEWRPGIRFEKTEEQNVVRGEGTGY